MNCPRELGSKSRLATHWVEFTVGGKTLNFSHSYMKSKATDWTKSRHSSLPHRIVLDNFCEEYPVKVTTKEFEMHICIRKFSRIPLQSQKRLILLTSLLAQLSFTHTNPTYSLQAQCRTSASSQEGQTSGNSGMQPQPGIAHWCRHLAQAA